MLNESTVIGTRHRKDRVASQIALTVTCVLGLLVIGGVWWLLSPKARAEAGEPVQPLRMLDSRTGTAHFAASDLRHADAQTTLLDGESLVAPPIVKGVITSVHAKPALKPEKPAKIAPAPSKKSGPTFNGRPLRKAGTMKMLVTAYSPDARSCGTSADNITASGYSVWTNGMKMVAADKNVFPFGTLVSVPGYDGGNPVPVLDRGGAIKGQRLDLLYPTHEAARVWGKKWVEVTVWEYAD